MPYRSAFLPAVSALVLGLFLALGSPVYAQQGAAPAPLATAPGASKAGEGGLSSAPASLPGGPNGASPLEPYLVTWLLPVSGIIAVFMAVYADRQIRTTHALNIRAASRRDV